MLVNAVLTVLFDDSCASKQCKRARCIPSSSPASTSVQVHALLCEDVYYATPCYALWVCLSFDLEHIQRQQHNLYVCEKDVYMMR
jgi:hypothetical protein